MKIVDAISNEYYGGHYTLLTFTTNVKFSFSTVTERDDILELDPYDDVNEAIENAIQSHFLKQNEKKFKVKAVAKIPKL